MPNSSLTLFSVALKRLDPVNDIFIQSIMSYKDIIDARLTKKEHRLYFTEFFRTVDILLLFICHSRPSTFALKIIILRTQ